MSKRETEQAKDPMAKVEVLFIGLIALLLFGLIVAATVMALEENPWRHASTEAVQGYEFKKVQGFIYLQVETDSDFHSLRLDQDVLSSDRSLHLYMTDKEPMTISGLYLESEAEEYGSTGLASTYVLQIPKRERKDFMKAYFEFYRSEPEFLTSEKIEDITEDTGMSLEALQETASPIGGDGQP